MTKGRQRHSQKFDFIHHKPIRQFRRAGDVICAVALYEYRLGAFSLGKEFDYGERICRTID